MDPVTGDEAQRSSTPDARTVFDALPGTWDLERRLDPTIGTMRGTATFAVLGPDQLVYHEEGELRLRDGYVGTATRSYRYRRTDEGIDVLFAEDRAVGGLMHRLHLVASGAGTVVGVDVHPCGDDRYAGRYEFRLPSLIVVTMRVRGPAKEYDTTTRLTPRRGVDQRVDPGA